MPLLKLRSPGQSISCDGRWVFVELLGNGNVVINSEPVPTQNISALVGKLMESRAERVVYLNPSPEASYSRFVETLEVLRASAPDVHVGVLSGSVRKEYVRSDWKGTYLPCDIVWPANEFHANK